MSLFDLQEAKELLMAADVFFDSDDRTPEYTLNMNDVWGWAWADATEVPEEDLPELADLFYRYGWCGILFWVSKKEGRRSEFYDNNRFIDFVAAEEKLRKDVPDSSKRAYIQLKYTLQAE